MQDGSRPGLKYTCDATLMIRRIHVWLLVKIFEFIEKKLLWSMQSMQDGFRLGFRYTCDATLALHCVDGKGEKGCMGV
jgi:hypothetical protein